MLGSIEAQKTMIREVIVGEMQRDFCYEKEKERFLSFIHSLVEITVIRKEGNNEYSSECIV